MKILISNDDGIHSAGLWVLANHLRTVGSVTIVAPDREQSATGTSLTLRHPLRVSKVASQLEGVECWATEGLPGDAVILGLEHVLEKPVDLVVSGINNGPNVGDDVLISGTVGAVLQAYLRNVPAIAVSTFNIESTNHETPARLAAIIAKDIADGKLSGDIFLNINTPDIPLDNIKGIRLCHLAHKTHIDTVKEGHDGRREFYWLVRRKLDLEAADGTDIKAIERDCISVTELHVDLFRTAPISNLETLCQEWFKKLESPK
ncbi:5'-nucleotidase [Dehalogenimonas formicexedens]|uniref:5'-nucleotidase SurE n=1 Tax=Dehalogenimonas formicexedens TaxID=1839801 RepID=A0A1P8F7D4_9CHLR|nr:5'/3'-nucleotidase SurE [Dehalogenimonas formicexedens]APV44343.1 5'-nucleotidase [Dehalogenimonas formicexedens]